MELLMDANQGNELPLRGRVAVVTGASRGVGRGIALGLGEAGATVYLTGRSVRGGAAVSDVPGTIDEAAEEVTRLGGRGIPIRCDHRDAAAVGQLFHRVAEEQGRLDVLVNSVWGGYENMVEGGAFTFEQPFWLQPLWRWDAMFAAGVRACYVASQFAARMMLDRGRGLIVAVSFWAGQKYKGNVAYGVSKAATDRLVSDMAHELRPHNIAAVSLYPGMVRTERVIQFAEYLDLSNSESPLFVGRAVAALAEDPGVLDKSGKVLVAAALAEEYGFTDLDGRRPRALTLAEA
jgi:NAD(P)-dependent dehydrogenase (short-subunit alcohol dehydrogenase family)